MITFHIVSLDSDKQVIPQSKLTYWIKKAASKKIAGVFADYYEHDTPNSFSYTLKYTQRIA